jgi:hypothetical protein
MPSKVNIKTNADITSYTVELLRFECHTFKPGSISICIVKFAKTFVYEIDPLFITVSACQHTTTTKLFFNLQNLLLCQLYKTLAWLPNPNPNPAHIYKIFFKVILTFK